MMMPSGLRTTVTITGLVAMIWACATAGALGKDATARIVSTKGQATAQLPGSNRALPVKTGDNYPVGTKLETGSNGQIGLAFSSGGGLALGASSRLILDQLTFEQKDQAITSRQARLSLETGRAAIFLNKVEGPTDFAVKTPRGLAVAHGTIWNIDITGGSLAVVNDRVVFTSTAGGTFDLGPSQGLKMTGGTIQTEDVSQEELDEIIRFLENAGFDVEVIGGEGTIRLLKIKPQEAPSGFLDTRGPSDQGVVGGTQTRPGEKPIVSPSQP